jgi:hypothetical protein
MAECSPHKAGHLIPAVVFALLTTSGRTVCRRTSTADPGSADPPAATGTEPAEAARQQPLDPDVRRALRHMPLAGASNLL